MARKPANKAQAAATEDVKVGAVVEDNAVEKAPEADKEQSPAKEEVKGEVVRETVHQLGIFSDYIYNVMNKGAKVVVENLGYGDIYVDSEGLAKVGKSKRLMFKESAEFEGVEKLYLVSASQPVAQILEIK